MWGRICLLSLVGLSSVGASAQDRVPVTFAWDLDPTHNQEAISWEIEANGESLPCESVTVTVRDRRCTAQIALGSYTFRLRSTLDASAWCAAHPDHEACPPDDPLLVGGWSAPLEATVAGPGPFTIRFHREIAGDAMAIGDTFDVGIDTSLEDHTATGPDGGFTWTVTDDAGVAVDDEVVVEAATDEVVRSGNTLQIARASQGLGSADVSVSLDIASWAGGSTTRLILLHARLSADRADWYEYVVREVSTDTHRIFRSVGGVISQVGSTVNGNVPAEGDTLTLEVDGSTIRGLVNGVERISVSDGELTTGEHVGFGFAGSSTGQRVDNFVAEAVGGAAQADGSSAGTSTVAGAAIALSHATGNASGIAAAQGEAVAVAQTTGQSDGIAAVSGVAGAQARAAGAALGSSAAAGISNNLAPAVGSAAGSATATGSAVALLPATGISTGASAADAIGRALALVIGDASGSSLASALARARVLADGVAAGSSLVSGVIIDASVTQPPSLQVGSVAVRQSTVASVERRASTIANVRVP